MPNTDRADLRRRIEDKAQRNDWTDRWRVTVTNTETGRTETVEVSGRDAHHAARTNAMFLLEMPLRGELIEHDVEKV